MDVDEEMILKSLVLGDINDLRNFCDDFVDRYMKSRKIGSISRKKYLDFLTDFHSTFLNFMEKYK